MNEQTRMTPDEHSYAQILDYFMRKRIREAIEAGTPVTVLDARLAPVIPPDWAEGTGTMTNLNVVTFDQPKSDPGGRRHARGVARLQASRTARCVLLVYAATVIDENGCSACMDSNVGFCDSGRDHRLSPVSCVHRVIAQFTA